MNLRSALPLSLTTLRLLLGPVIFLLAFARRIPWLMTICILVALLSDVFDGIIARRLGTTTEFLRRYDSIADTSFYCGVAAGAWILYPTTLRANAIGLGALLFLEAARHVFDRIKFRKAASYHSWLAKAWGLVLAAASIALMEFGIAGGWLRAAILLGILVNVEGLIISLVLPCWQHDVPTLWHALNLRKQARAGTVSPRS